MLITSLLPLLSRFSLGCDLVAGPDQTVTLTIIPRKAAGATNVVGSNEIRPISITGTADEIDAELAKTAAAKTKAPAKAAAKPAAEKSPVPPAPATPPPAPAAAAPAAESKPGEPASLW